MKIGVARSDGPESPASNTSIEVIVALRALGEADPAFADLYLCRAERFLAPLLSRREFEGLERERAALPELRTALRDAIQKTRWEDAQSLAEAAESSLARVSRLGSIAELAGSIYGPRSFAVSPVTLALNGLTSHPGVALERERATLCESLRVLADRDAEWRALYIARAQYFDRLRVTAGDESLLVEPQELVTRLSQAVDESNFGEVRRLTQLLARTPRAGSLGRLRPVKSGSRKLANALPEQVVRIGHDLGLAPETVAAAPLILAYLTCACGDCPTFPERPLSEGSRRVGTCRTCGHAGPPGVSSLLRENLDLLLLHPFMTSAGSRYLPCFDEETVLVETFSEDDPDARTTLLTQLGLSQRRGLPRLVIEDATRVHGARIVEGLGLDPFEFTLACIPFDVYCRLAPSRGWGRERLWTHFDGYQLARDLNLLALVGGDVRYGGGEDLCAVQRNYDPPKITARFCVLRRERLLPAMRGSEQGPDPGLRDEAIQH